MGAAPAGVERSETGHHHVLVDRPPFGKGPDDAAISAEGIPSDAHHRHFGGGQTQTELTQMKERAQAEIRSATEQAVSELYEQTAALATQVAGKILQREISADDQRELVQRSLAELGGAGRQN